MGRRYIVEQIISDRRRGDRTGDMRGDYYDAYEDMYSEEMYDSRSMNRRDMMDGRRMRGSNGRFIKSDGGHTLKLTKSDMSRWKRNLENADGSHGPHFSVGQIMQSAHHAGIRFDEYDEKEFCMAMNVLYSDFCEAARGFISPDKEMLFFAKFADAFLNDEDGPEASEKLALYFHCIVDD